MRSGPGDGAGGNIPRLTDALSAGKVAAVGPLQVRGLNRATPRGFTSPLFVPPPTGVRGSRFLKIWLYPSMQVLVTASIYRRLEAEAERRGAAVDEVAVELLERALGASLDPPERAEFHRGLAEKFLREAEELLAKGDYVQASEKAWGAAAQIVKAVAAKAGKELKSHGDLWRFVSEIAGEDRELRRLWSRANSLHQNFYEGWMPPEDVRYAVEDVKQFVERLKRML
jgi:HEPN domain-containing protein